MTEAPDRYDAKVEGELVSIDSDEGWLPVGATEEIVALVDGETYTVEYDERSRTTGSTSTTIAAWRST